MPKVYKTLADIAVWTLWICAWIAFIFPFIIGSIIKGYLIDPTNAPAGFWISFALANASAFGAGFWILVRRKLEEKLTLGFRFYRLISQIAGRHFLWLAHPP